MADAYIAGWAHTAFGKLADQTVESLVRTVTREALDHAGVSPTEIDEIYLGHYNAGLTAQAFPSSLPLQAHDALRFVPSTRVENACATGSAAVHHGVRAVSGGHADTVLVIGVESMTPAGPAAVGRALLGADHARAGTESQSGFAEIFAEITQHYFDRYGDHSEVLAAIAAKNHRNGLDNPYAQLRKDLGFEFCNTVSDRNPLVAGPLRRTDCSPVSDGAAAMVLTTADRAASTGAQVRVRSTAHANEFLPMSRRDPTFFEAGKVAWDRALERAGLDLWDLDLIETHDCFTIAELIEYEMFGMTDRGRGRTVVDEGWALAEGRLPVNRSGGLKAKGHPVGATGVSQHVLAAMQLSGAAGDMQLDAPALAGVFNMGGTAVANYATILERVR